MKTFPFLEKPLTWILLAASLPLAPALAIAWPRRTVIESFTRIHARLSGEGPQRDITEELTRLQRTAPLNRLFQLRNLMDKPRWSAGPWLWSSPELRPVASCLEQQFASYLREYAALSRSGRVDWTRYRPEIIGVGSGPHPERIRVNISTLEQPLSSLAIALAQAKESAGDTEAALAYAAAAVEVFHAQGLSEDGFDPETEAARQMTRLAAGILADSASSSTQTMAVASLERLSFLVSPPPLTSEILESPGERSLLQTRSLQQVLATRAVLAGSAWALARDRKHLTQRENLAWTGRLFDASPDTTASLPNPLRGLTLASPPWTLFPALQKQFAHAVRTENDLLWQRAGGRPVFRDTDPVDAALYTYGIESRKFHEFRRHSAENWYLRMLATERNAVRLAAAARTYRSTHGQWPQGLDDLVPAWTTLTATPAEITTPSLQSSLLTPGLLPYPLQVGSLPVTKDNLPDFLGLKHGPNHPSLTWNSRNLTSPESTSEPAPVRFHLELKGGYWTEFPLAAFAMADQIRQSSPDAVTSVAVSMSQGQPPIPLSRTEATSITLTNLPFLPQLCPSLTPHERPSLPLSASVQVGAVVEVPREHFAVWSRGPNPTSSYDDIILFLRE